MKIRIYYEDTDCGGVVYYANYLRYFERARTEFMRERGLDVADFAGKGILFVVSKVEINYISPVRYNDLLEIQTEIPEAGRASFTFRHRVHKEGQAVVEGSARLVCVNQDGKPRRLPEEVARMIETELASKRG